jgi:hypothetical protein
MKNGLCSKCGKREVRCSPEKRAQGHGHILALSAFKNAVLKTYVCTACGWMEQWMDRPQDREVVAEKWERPR